MLAVRCDNTIVVVASESPLIRSCPASVHAEIRSALEGEDDLMQTAGIRPLDALAALSDVTSGPGWLDPAQKVKVRLAG